MKGTTIFVAVIVVIVAVAGIVVYVQNVTDFPNKVNTSTSVLMNSGTIITINSSDQVMYGGAAAPHEFYGIDFNLSLNNYYILTGSWESTGKSLVWVLGNNEFYAEYPIPDETTGMLNQTLLPSSYGNYTLVVAGYPGDRISVIKSIEVRNYTPSQVGSFSIPKGTKINSVEIYSFYLNRPGVLAGSFTTGGGIYSYSLLNSPSNDNWGSASVTDYNSSATPALVEFNLSQNPPLVFGPGNCSIIFEGGTFYVNQTLAFFYFYDNSS